jgi:hypothetical protein
MMRAAKTPEIIRIVPTSIGENGRCIVPGCKNATFAQAHHLTARAAESHAE